MTEPATEDTKTCDSAEKAEASTAEKQETKDPSDDKEEHTNHPGMSTDTQFSLQRIPDTIYSITDFWGAWQLTCRKL